MKDIPIVIQNKDRLDPLKMLVNALHERNYTNIIILDNESTYEPLLEWYPTSGTDVFINTFPQTKFDTGAFYRLAVEMHHPKFVDIIKDYYVFTDSDVVPVEEAPDDFISGLREVRDQYNAIKVGLGIKLDDLPNTPTSAAVMTNALNWEAPYWKNKLPNDKYEVYAAGIDTSFALYGPNALPKLEFDNTYRLGGKYMARHIPWYYDVNNLPEDEDYYIQHLKANRGPAISSQIKNLLGYSW